MESKGIDRVINYFRSLHEEGSPVNAVGPGGLTGSAQPPGRLDGFDPVMGFKRRGPQIKLPPGSRRRWMKKKKSQ
jgi:hypothetical protein